MFCTEYMTYLSLYCKRVIYYSNLPLTLSQDRFSCMATTFDLNPPSRTRHAALLFVLLVISSGYLQTYSTTAGMQSRWDKTKDWVTCLILWTLGCLAHFLIASIYRLMANSLYVTQTGHYFPCVVPYMS